MSVWEYFFNNLYWIIPSLVSAILSFFILLNAVKQKNIQKQNIKLSLFDKRFRIYENTMKFIIKILEDTSIKIDINDYASGCREIKFLFDDNIINYFNELIKNGQRLEVLKKRYDKLKKDDKKIDKNLNEQGSIIDWFNQEFNEGALNRFDKYINVNKLGLK